MAFEEGLLVESLQALDREVELFDRRGALVLRQKLRDARIVRAINGNVCASLPSGVRRLRRMS